MIAVVIVIMILWALCYKDKSVRDDDEQERILKEELDARRK